MNELYLIRTIEDENSLQHYGVLGMKWGVRRNPSRAYGKAVKKANKLDKRIDKARKTLIKRNKKLAKVSKRYAGVGFASRGDLAKATQKYYKADRKLLKTEKKYGDWIKSMNKYFKDVPISKIDEKTLSRGREYSHFLLNK